MKMTLTSTCTSRLRTPRRLLAIAAGAATLVVPSSPAAATTVGVGTLVTGDGCPGTVINTGNGSARIGLAPYQYAFRSALSLTLLLPVSQYHVSLVWQDPVKPQSCARMGIGSFTASLLGVGTFGMITPASAWVSTWPNASYTGDYRIWIEADPGSWQPTTGSLVSAPITCHQPPIAPVPNPADCPVY